MHAMYVLLWVIANVLDRLVIIANKSPIVPRAVARQQHYVSARRLSESLTDSKKFSHHESSLLRHTKKVITCATS